MFDYIKPIDELLASHKIEPTRYEPPKQVFPKFLIIGAPKCGTTAAVVNLIRHPDVWMPTDKIIKRINGADAKGVEPHFFSRDANYRRGLDWYARYFEDGEGHACIGEKTPNYLMSIEAQQRIAQNFPDMKLIILVREPVSRAYSFWRHMVQEQVDWSGNDWHTMSFEAAVEHDLSVNTSDISLLGGGCYSLHIAQLLKYFKRSQIHIAITERVWAEREVEYGRMFDFLGVPGLEGQEYRQFHQRGKGVIHNELGDVSKATLDTLDEYFALFNRELRELLDDPIDEWERLRNRPQVN